MLMGNIGIKNSVNHVRNLKTAWADGRWQRWQSNITVPSDVRLRRVPKRMITLRLP
jgi:hypothetical protein